MLLFKTSKVMKRDNVVREVRDYWEFKKDFEYEGEKLNYVCSVMHPSNNGYNLYKVEGKQNKLYKSHIVKEGDELLEILTPAHELRVEDVIDQIEMLNYEIENYTLEDEISKDEVLRFTTLTKERDIILRNLKEIIK